MESPCLTCSVSRTLLLRCLLPILCLSPNSPLSCFSLRIDGLSVLEDEEERMMTMSFTFEMRRAEESMEKTKLLDSPA